VRAGDRCAEVTSISNGIENFAKIFTDSFMIGRSVSEPMMMPTRGLSRDASPLLNAPSNIGNHRTLHPNLVSARDSSAFNNLAEHTSAVLKGALQSHANLVHTRTWLAPGRDLKHSFPDQQSLTRF
jgi:hypothetical protein